MFGLETDRLLIRPWVDADRPALKELLQDTEVTRYIHEGKSFSELPELGEYKSGAVGRGSRTQLRNRRAVKASARNGDGEQEAGWDS